MKNVQKNKNITDSSTTHNNACQLFLRPHHDAGIVQYFAGMLHLLMDREELYLQQFYEIEQRHPLTGADKVLTQRSHNQSNFDFLFLMTEVNFIATNSSE